MIKTKQKTVELRLNDERRRLIKKGDTIIFTNNETNETLNVIVLNIKRYHDFNELYNNYSKESIGYKSNELADPKDMLLYYTQAQVNTYGVLAIEISLN